MGEEKEYLAPFLKLRLDQLTFPNSLGKERSRRKAHFLGAPFWTNGVSHISGGPPAPVRLPGFTNSGNEGKVWRSGDFTLLRNLVGRLKKEFSTRRLPPRVNPRGVCNMFRTQQLRFGGTARQKNRGVSPKGVLQVPLIRLVLSVSAQLIITPTTLWGEFSNKRGGANLF